MIKVKILFLGVSVFKKSLSIETLISKFDISPLCQELTHRTTYYVTKGLDSDGGDGGAFYVV